MKYSETESGQRWIAQLAEERLTTVVWASSANTVGVEFKKGEVVHLTRADIEAIVQERDRV